MDMKIFVEVDSDVRLLRRSLYLLPLLLHVFSLSLSLLSAPLFYFFFTSFLCPPPRKMLKILFPSSFAFFPLYWITNSLLQHTLLSLSLSLSLSLALSRSLSSFQSHETSRPEVEQLRVCCHNTSALSSLLSSNSSSL
jgi:hypothetical protein